MASLLAWEPVEMKLKKVGFFRELRHGMLDGPLLRSLISEAPQENEQRIVSYLKGGVMFIATPAIVEDVLDPGQLIGSPHILTDGVWAWSGDLPHYVEKYHVCLPSEFVAHMEKNNWAVPSEESLHLDQLES
jgi:hypothetical protein